MAAAAGRPKVVKHTLVIDVSGGVVQAVFSDASGDELDVILVDWDNINGSDGKEGGFVYGHSALDQMPEETAEQADRALRRNQLPDVPGEAKDTFVFHGPGPGDVWWINAPSLADATVFMRTKDRITLQGEGWPFGRYMTQALDGVDAVVDGQCNAIWEAPEVPWHNFKDLDEDDPKLTLRPDRSVMVENNPEYVLDQCECDNTHQTNGTVCRWCWANGRRTPSDPEVDLIG